MNHRHEPTVIRVTCPHCHSTVTLTGSPTRCWRCGHDASAPRSECSCARCLLPAPPPSLSPEDFNQLLEDLARRGGAS